MSATIRLPRVVSQGLAVKAGGNIDRTPLIGNRLEEKTFAGDTISEVSLDEIVETRNLKGATASIGLRGGSWQYCLRPKEFNLSDSGKLSLEAALRKLPESEEIDVTGLMADQKLARELIKTAVAGRIPRIPGLEREEAAEIVSRYSVGFGAIELLLSDPLIEDVIVSSPSSANLVCVVTRLQKGGSGSAYCRTNLRVSEEQLASLVAKASIFHGGELSTTKPILELEIPHLRTRLSAAAEPASHHGTCLAFRRRSEQLWTLPRQIAENSLSWTAAGFLSLCCEARASIVVAGGRGSGKTTLLASLLPELPDIGRTLVMEDTEEIPTLQLQHEGLSIQTLSLAGGIEKASSVMRAALRMGDGAIVVGEIRGEEARILFESMRTGTASSSVLGTLHASDSNAVRDRIVFDMGLSEKSFQAIDLIVLTSQWKDPASGTSRRHVSEIGCVCTEGGSDLIAPLFKVDDQGNWVTCPFEMRRLGALGDRMAAHVGIEMGRILQASRTRGFLKKMQAAEWQRTGDDRTVSVKMTRAMNRIPVDYASPPDPIELREAALSKIREGAG
jgi:archaeal flagellar protein FlaI